MNSYYCTFLGKTKGALGNFYWYSYEVKAETKEEARLKLYETFDQVHHLKIDEKEEEK
jgi:hypothetical protein